jgi:hypothetical protein
MWCSNDRFAFPFALGFLGVLSGPILTATAAMEPRGWQIEVADYGKQFTFMTDRSLRLDSSGRPHIAYGEDNLYYAFYDGLGLAVRRCGHEATSGHVRSTGVG